MAIKVGYGPISRTKQLWGQTNNITIAFIININNLFSENKALPQIYIFHIYTGPKSKQILDLHGSQIYTNPDVHGTLIYTTLIYTNPFPHINKKKKLHNPNLHKTFSSNFAQTISSEFHYQHWLVQKRRLPVAACHAQR